METTCGSLLSELQKIWDEIGEPDIERDKMLFELEQECLEAYQRKVDQANRCHAYLRQSLADSEALLADISAALGDLPFHINKFSGSLKKKLQDITPQLEDMKRKRNERKSQFLEVLEQINSIAKDLSGSTEKLNMMALDEGNMSLKKLDDLQNQLLLLQKEKSARLKQVLDQLSAVNSLCLVLGIDFNLTVRDIHPTLVTSDNSHGLKSIGLDTVDKLSTTISRLKDVKLQRMKKLQNLAVTMVELWNLMDTAVEEQQKFQNVTCAIATSECEITEPSTLSLEFITRAEAEVARLGEMKMSKMKEVLMKKMLVLEEIRREARMVVEGKDKTALSLEVIESAAIDPSCALEQLEDQISKAKEEAFSRKETLEKVQKWLAACEEECWLEEYNKDDKRYNAGKGAHLMLKRAEKARVLVNKIPAMMDTLKSKAKAWEKERGVDFLYDGVGLMSMVEKYSELRHLKEQENQRQRDQKKIQGQLMVEQEAMFGSKQSPWNGRNKNRPLTGALETSKRFSLGGVMLQNMLTEKATPSSRSMLKNNEVKQQCGYNHHQSSFVAHSSGKKKMSGGPVKQHSSNATNSQHIPKSPIRKPLSPLSSLSSNITSFNFQDQNATSGEFQETIILCRTPVGTPTKNASSFSENRTPKT